LRLVSICFDGTMKNAEKGLRRGLGGGVLADRLEEIGIKADTGNVRQAVLEGLRNGGVEIHKDSESAVLGTIEKLGLDFDRFANMRSDPFGTGFGKNSDLFLVPEKLQELFYEAIGRSSMPMLFVVDRKGRLRFSSYPEKDEIFGLVEKLISE